jgi:serine/threonine-protein kinase
MADDDRILELVEEVLDSGRTPKEVCARDPELLEEVRACLKRFQGVNLMVRHLFPVTDLPECPTFQLKPRDAVPNIPGYEVLEVLGRGGNGIIYRVRHLKLNRVAALKMLLSGEFASPVELARFTRETKAVAALQHPNIVQIYDVGEADGRPYFTMEFIGGGSLAKKLAGIPQPAKYCASLTETVARAIHAGHLAGIVHRDVKPGNILLATDGTPKMADFGLARHFEEGPEVTLGPAKIGTTSYMAPEQVVGKPGTVGPPADVYSLGATLYELLTGRPPFRAESAAETERQVLTQEPAAPSKLNAKVPRDLETICLKCLQKEPARRYESAEALADDLKRFSEGRPIQARPVGWAARSWRWCRRNPMASGLLLMAIALVGLASGGGTWLLQQRARRQIEQRSDIDATVTQAASLRKSFHYSEARALLQQARQRLQPSAPDDLHKLVAQTSADLELAERLDLARAQVAILMETEHGLAAAGPRYGSAFAEAGLGRVGDDTVRVAEAVKHSALRADIVAALDDWASITPDFQQRKWLLEVARRADPDAARDHLRQPELWQDAKGLTTLAKELKVTELSPQLATALARASSQKKADAVPLLISAQAHFPHDFWVNLELGWALSSAGRPAEGLGYSRAALSLRPDAGVAHVIVGLGLDSLGRHEEAAEQYRQALRVEPEDFVALNNLGTDLALEGQEDEAIDFLQRALKIEPNNAVTHLNLGWIMQHKGRYDEAMGFLREAIRLDPDSARTHGSLGATLRLVGRVDEGISELEQSVRLNPKSDIFIITLEDTRYAAACSAARAAGKRRAGEPERAGLRRQALDRLRANLELTTRMMNEGKPTTWSLPTWQTDPALASVRDPVELAKLPVDEREQWRRLWADLAAIIASDLREQGRMCAARREWTQAAGLYGRYLARGLTDDGQVWYEYAALSLLSADRVGYTRACAHLVETFNKPGGPRGYHVARACTLGPDAVEGPSLPGRLANKELQQNTKQFWARTELGALAYRSGRFEEAVSLFEQSLKADTHAGRAVVNWVWLALAEERLGKTDEARSWLEKAQTWLDQYRDGVPPNAEAQTGLHFHNWLEANILRREAETLLSSK